MIFSYQTRIIASTITMVAVLVLILVALSFPRIDRTVKVMDMLFVLDITQSMEVQDVELGDQSVSRLAWAKNYTRNTLINLSCGSHVGLAVFTESRSLILINPVEVCENYNDLIQMIAKINSSMAWALSSEVSKASFSAIKQAKLIQSNPSIVFITDGHESPPLHKTLFAKFKGEPGEISGVFVGVGGDDLLPIPKYDKEGKEIGFWGVNDVLHSDVYASSRGDFDELNANKARTEHLSSQKKTHIKELATMVGFDYVLSPEKPKELIKKIESVAHTRDQLVSYDWSPWLAGVALFLLALLYLPFNVVSNKE